MLFPQAHKPKSKEVLGSLWEESSSTQPNALQVERLRPEGCESRGNGFACEKVEQEEPQKPVPPTLAPAPPFLQGAGTLPPKAPLLL